jgi:hypothetical protein
MADPAGGVADNLRGDLSGRPIVGGGDGDAKVLLDLADSGPSHLNSGDHVQEVVLDENDLSGLLILGPKAGQQSYSLEDIMKKRTLSPLQKIITELLCQGMSTKEVAEKFARSLVSTILEGF